MTTWSPNNRAARQSQLKWILMAVFTAGLSAGCSSDRLVGPGQDLELDAAVLPQAENGKGALPGTGNADVLRLLETFNNQVVACYATHDIEYVTGSHLTLLTSVLRFPPTPGAKLNSLLNTLVLQIEIGRRDGKILPSCADTLMATVQTLQGL